MAEKEAKVTIMVLKVDLQCPKCYKKVKKVLCKFPQIRDQVYNEKADTVTIKVVCCSPEKIRDKLCYKGGRSIKSIEIKPPEKPEKKPEKEKPKEVEKKEQERPKQAPTKRPDAQNGGDPLRDEPTVGKGGVASNLPYRPPASPVIGFCCSEDSSDSGTPGNPCCGGGPVQNVGYHGRPIYDSWGGGWCDYFSEENQQSCSIMQTCGLCNLLFFAFWFFVFLGICEFCA